MWDSWIGKQKYEHLGQSCKRYNGKIHRGTNYIECLYIGLVKIEEARWSDKKKEILGKETVWSKVQRVTYYPRMDWEQERNEDETIVNSSFCFTLLFKC